MNQLDDWQDVEPTLLDFESAWQSGAPELRTFEERLPRARRLQGLTELVLIDLEQRQRRGEAISLDHYFRLYPELDASSECVEVLHAHQQKLSETAAKNEQRDFLNQKTQAGESIGPYLLEEVLGRGAFSVVFRATDGRLSRNVALKILHAEGHVSTEMRSRLLREAQAQASLQHPGIVPVFEIGEYKGIDYIASRLVEGRSLESELQVRQFELPETLQLGIALADALEHAHFHGIVHRDIKPANIMLEKGTPVIVDFGLAQITDAPQTLTHAGDIVGTPAFMSPEQADGRAWQSDPRSDVYSLGAVLYRMLCGRLPFEGSTTAVINQVLHRTPVKPRLINPKINGDIQTVLLKCLAKEPNDRYQTAAELRDDLQACEEGRPILAKPVGQWGQFYRWSRRHPRIALMLAACFVLALFSAGIVTQLSRVSQQRNRATAAEAEVQQLLASASANAGRTAMQRGQMREAIAAFEQAIKSGYEQPSQLLIPLLEANHVLGNKEQANQLLQELIERGEERDASVVMWRMELALDRDTSKNSAAELLSELRAGELPEADAEYVCGLAALSTPEAVEHFEAAIAKSPFHYRARRLLIISLLSLMQLEEVEEHLQVARQMFPESDDFRLLAALNAGLNDRHEQAEQFVLACNMEPANVQAWLELCEFVSKLKITDDVGDNAELDPKVLCEHFLVFSTDYLSLVRQRQWRLPLAVEQSLVNFVNEVAELGEDANSLEAPTLSTVAEAHPVASLQILNGNKFIARVLADGIGNDQAIQHLEAARSQFHAATSSTGFLRDGSIYAWKGVFVASVTLGLLRQYETAENLQQAMAASRQIPVDRIVSENAIRTFVVAALNADDRSESQRWIDRWLHVANQNESNLLNPLWNQAVLHKRNEHWIQVLTTCDALLAINDEPRVQGLRNDAINKLKEHAAKSHWITPRHSVR